MSESDEFAYDCRENLGFLSLTFPMDMKELNRDPASILQSMLKNFEE